MEIIKKIFRKPSGQKAKSLKTLALFLGAVLVVNVAASFLFFRLDLTSDKRFTLSQVTKDKLKGVKDVVYVKVYLDGDMPIAFKKMKRLQPIAVATCSTSSLTLPPKAERSRTPCTKIYTKRGFAR
jgi:hypothetical protein